MLEITGDSVIFKATFNVATEDFTDPTIKWGLVSELGDDYSLGHNILALL